VAENTGAAFGVFPQMRPRRAQQDRTASANAPLSALRGYAAGTAGLPGDIEGLLRSGLSQVPSQFLNALPALRAFGIGSRADPTPQLPTTEFYNQYLPGAELNQTPTGKAFTTAGNLLGGAGSTNIAGLGVKSTNELANLAARIAAESPRAGSRAAQRGVIKAPGGNWLSGSVEDSLRGLKRHQNPEEALQLYASSAANPATTPETLVQLNQRLPQWQREAALNNFIDKQLTRYVKNEMATPGDPIRALAEKWAVDKPAKLAEVQSRIDALGAKVAQVAGERGVPPEYLTSMRQQMIGLEKEKALLQLREGSHAYTPEGALYGDWLPEQVAVSRMKAGFPIHGVSVSPVARAWENASDAALDVSTAGKHTLPLTESEIRRGYLSNVDKNPWLLKVPPETPVYYPEKSFPEELGFNHLIDELRNATNPESGLPAELLLKYKDLPKITVPQAVERVADINAWRAAQKVEADMARANNAATQVFKEYPEQGMKWVELKEPGVNPDAGLHDAEGTYKTLSDALKYEGDTMQHCVGGYCPDVAEGRSRIYSLRDSKGQPHATVETVPFGQDVEDAGDIYTFAENMGLRPNTPSTKAAYAQYLAENTLPQERIVQIKGKKNRAPAPEYLPFVQDFVKSGKWSDVGDLQNTGLRDISGWRGQVLDYGADPTKAEAFFSRLPNRYASQSELDELMGPLGGDYTFSSLARYINNPPPAPGMALPPEPGFAAGGMVATSPNQGYNQARVDELADSLLAELF